MPADSAVISEWRGSAVRKLGRLDALEAFRMIAVVMEHVVLHLRHVGEAQLAVRTLMDDLGALHEAIVRANGAKRTARFITPMPQRAGTRTHPASSNVHIENEGHAS